MADLDKADKVIKGLECCSQMVGECCRECPYADECEEGEGLLAGSAHLAADALALLKAQEPVKPIFDELSVTGACGNCGHELTYQKMIGENVLFEERYDYCPACGRKVLWDGDT